MEMQTLEDNLLNSCLVIHQHKLPTATRHPHRTLPPSITLVAADCVPNARLYYGGATTGSTYLSEDTLAKKSSYSGACSSLNNL